MTTVSNRELCERFGIAIYLVGEVYETDKAGHPILDEDKDKWFVSAPVGTFAPGEIEAISLSDTEEQAEALAVEKLGLRELWQTIEGMRSENAFYQRRRAVVCPECAEAVQVVRQERAPLRVLIGHALGLLLVLCVGALLASAAGISEERINLLAMLVVPVGLAWLLAGVVSDRQEGFFCRGCGYSE